MHSEGCVLQKLFSTIVDGSELLRVCLVLAVRYVSFLCCSEAAYQLAVSEAFHCTKTLTNGRCMLDMQSMHSIGVPEAAGIQSDMLPRQKESTRSMDLQV